MPEIQIDDLSIKLTRKKIKTFRIRVYPPHGDVRVSAPVQMTDRQIAHAIRERMDWIREHRQKMVAAPAIIEPQYLTGEQHALWGETYPLVCRDVEAHRAAVFLESSQLVMACPPNVDLAKRRAMLEAFYRTELKARIHECIGYWQSVVGVEVAEWNVKRMKTRWGSCNITDRRIWLSLSLAKKSYDCLDYVLVHELVHLYERYHNARFYAFMDRFLPDWRERREQLEGRSV